MHGGLEVEARLECEVRPARRQLLRVRVRARATARVRVWIRVRVRVRVRVRLLWWQLVRERELEEELSRSREPAIPHANPAADHGAQHVPDRVEDPLCKVLGRVGPQLGRPLRPMQAHGEPPCQVATPIVEGHAHERNEGGARERRPEEQKIWHRRLPREARAS